ncbi:hypothetical protein MJ584_05175 [Klebsiella pneumoniae]|nr:hypothetical protein MJ584_05175 [Klebsiella pneumoniae]
MQFDPPLQPAILLKRYKRFLADVVTPSRELTLHCPNTGAMTGAAPPGRHRLVFHLGQCEAQICPHGELTETQQGAVVASIRCARILWRKRRFPPENNS